MGYIFDIISSSNDDYNQGAKFWGDDFFKFDGSIEDKVELLKCVSNYVRMLTGMTIPVKYHTGDSSYTDGESIVISSRIEKDNIDSTIGLALHEASHIVKTDFDLIKELVGDATNIPIKYRPFKMLLKDLFNWVEDRRIDNWVYHEAYGYKKYYEALYKRYFLSDKVNKVIQSKSKEKNKESLDNYLFYIINSMNPNIKMDELKYLSEIKDIINLDDVDRLEDTESTLNVAIEILEVLINILPSEEKKNLRDDRYNKIKKLRETGGTPQNEGNNKSNGGDLSDAEIKDLIDEILETQRKFNDGEVTEDGKNIIIPITQEDADKVAEGLGDSSLKSDKTETVLKVFSSYYHQRETLLLNKINIDDLRKRYIGIYGGYSEYYHNAVKEGWSLGKLLAKKLKFREEIKVVKYVKQKTGKIYKRALPLASYDSPRLFYKKEVSEYPNIGIHITVDASGSMVGDNWYSSLLAVTAICKATSEITNIRTQLSFRYSNFTQNVVINFYDSSYDKVNKLRDLCYLKPDGGTPEGRVFRELDKEVIAPLRKEKMMFINFSDGYPESSAIPITRDYINKIRKEGVTILSYFISENEEAILNQQFIEMYGKDGRSINTRSLNSLAKSINKKLLEL